LDACSPVLSHSTARCNRVTRPHELGRHFTYGADSIHYPTSFDDVQELVARLTRVKALGTRHSFNDIADCSGALVSLSRMAPAITVDAEAMTVSVTGGTPYGGLAAELHSQGYALHNTGSLPHISVAGATATRYPRLG
jgi:alditol oxidase